MKTRNQLVLAISLLAFSCHQETSQKPQETKPLTPIEIKNDEIENVVSKSFVSLGRPVIRPTFVEVEKDKKAVQEGYVIYLSVKNKAKLTTYRDIKYQVVYLDKAGNEKDKETIVLNKILKPGDSISGENKLSNYKQMAYKVVLVSANALK